MILKKIIEIEKVNLTGGCIKHGFVGVRTPALVGFFHQQGIKAKIVE
jgi:hypothetical protein